MPLAIYKINFENLERMMNFMNLLAITLSDKNHLNKEYSVVP